MIKEVASFDEFSTASEGTALIKLGAPWCSPCKIMDKNLEELAKETDVQIYKVDVDEFPSIAQSLGVMSVPTTALFVNGNLVLKLNGVKDKNTLLEIIKREME